jgi:hypothetical protein
MAQGPRIVNVPVPYVSVRMNLTQAFFVRDINKNNMMSTVSTANNMFLLAEGALIFAHDINKKNWISLIRQPSTLHTNLPNI